MISVRRIVNRTLPLALRMLAGEGGVCEIHCGPQGEINHFGPTPLGEFLEMYACYGCDYSGREDFREARPHRPYIGIVHRDGTLLVEISKHQWEAVK